MPRSEDAQQLYYECNYEQAMDAIRGKFGKDAITFGNTGKFSGWDD